ncbi:MAG: hypothetical protein M1276_08910, partial [Deltaproteobacteria bacterium]|nr:hypothetical protein [Deltaproteobacteria bacterium]
NQNPNPNPKISRPNRGRTLTFKIERNHNSDTPNVKIRNKTIKNGKIENAENTENLEDKENP